MITLYGGNKGDQRLFATERAEALGRCNTGLWEHRWRSREQGGKRRYGVAPGRKNLSLNPKDLR